jgi:ADP-ribosylglycohydrolase
MYNELRPPSRDLGNILACSNRDVLDRLFAQNGICVERGAVFSRAPGPMPASFDFDRVEGMLLGLAIGDALANTTEGQAPDLRMARHGEIRGYLANNYAQGQAMGLPSDDTQLAFWTLEQMLADGGFDPAQTARAFCCRQIFGIGSAVQEFVYKFKNEGLPWYRCGTKSAGNGALMRIAPMLAPHLHTGTTDLWADTALSAMITHNDRASTAACLAFVAMLWELLQADAPPPAEWWVTAFVDVARDLEGSCRYGPRGGQFSDYAGPMCDYVEQRVGEALRERLPTKDACNIWHSGAYLMETLPSVLYILACYAHDPEEAMVRAVNDTYDNDTVASIVGAAVGALHGSKSFPRRWVDGLLGRTTDSDDGRVFELVSLARQRWWDKQADIRLAA